jgi:type I restriction enzyme M protein
MSLEYKRQLEQQLWNIANTLRGKMGADEFRDYILGFIFYKYLSERMNLYANQILKEDDLSYTEIQENTENGKAYLAAIQEEALLTLGYFLKPSELFNEIAKKGNAQNQEGKESQTNFILKDLTDILSNIERSTMGTDSEDDFDNLFEDLDLTSSKLGKTEAAKNDLIAKLYATASPEEKSKQKAEIKRLLDGEVQLRSKRELIEKFIEQNLPGIDDADNIPQSFETV